MKKIISFICILVAFCFAQHAFDYGAFSGVYDSSKGSAKFTHYVLTGEQVKSHSVKRGAGFWRDDSLATLSPVVFKHSGYDIGHLVPASDMEFRADFERLTFSTANVIPQDPGLNRGPWAVLEKSFRDSAIAWGSASIWTGPLYREKIGFLNGDKTRSSWNDRGTPIPSEVWKVGCNPHGTCFGFLYRNDGTEKDRAIAPHAIPIDSLVIWTGIRFK